MTQQEQAVFEQSLQAALSWMQAAQERLRLNDNTQGPRDALENRLRETEEIRESEHEGRVKMEVVLGAAEALLQNGDAGVKRETHNRLKELKALWEETTTYIIHCHSRIEWVWLHWSEYLKAYEEFQLWLTRIRRTLEPQLELQLDVREKLWQLDHHMVLLSDTQSQGTLLERLLDEAVALYGRTEDPTVGPEAQKDLQDSHDQIKVKIQERVAFLKKIVEEHQTYQSCAQRFLAWVYSKSEELSQLTESEDSVAAKLDTLQELLDNINQEEATLQHVENLAESVKNTTSPLGAEMVAREVELLRERWGDLKGHLILEQEKLHDALRTEEDYNARANQLQANVSQLRSLVQILSGELEGRNGERTEEQLVVLWRKYTDVYRALAEEEPQVEGLKAQLKELFLFSQNAGPMSEDVLAAVKEYQGVKSQAYRLAGDMETSLRKVLLDPLHGFRCWVPQATQTVGISEDSNFSNLALLIQNIENLLKDSLLLQERFSQLQVKEDLFQSLFQSEKAKDLRLELGSAVKEREHLHSQLFQKKNQLQCSLLKSNDFEAAYKSISERQAHLTERLKAASELQPDILAKKSQHDQLKIIMKELENFDAHFTALETLLSSSPIERCKFNQLNAEWRELFRSVRVKAKESERSINEHENFHESLLSVEKWLMIMKQKLDSFHDANGEWSVENRQTEAARALGEFPEKELQLLETETQGEKVLAKTSEEGRVHILRDLERLRDSWVSLHALSLNVHRLLGGDDTGDHTDAGSKNTWLTKGGFSHKESSSRIISSGLPLPHKMTSVRKANETEIIDGSIHQRKFHGDPKLQEEFETWLQGENNKLCKIVARSGDLSTKQLQCRRQELKALKSHVGWGQTQLKKLLASWGVPAAATEVPADLEELRYRWVLYKSKLDDANEMQIQAKHMETSPLQDKPITVGKKRSTFLSRVCWAALPLQLLLLALLLLAFLVPFMDEGASCSLTNNFARSFSLMLRYDGPPPT